MAQYIVLDYSEEEIKHKGEGFRTGFSMGVVCTQDFLEYIKNDFEHLQQHAPREAGSLSVDVEIERNKGHVKGLLAHLDKREKMIGAFVLATNACIEKARSSAEGLRRKMAAEKAIHKSFQTIMLEPAFTLSTQPPTPTRWEKIYGAERDKPDIKKVQGEFGQEQVVLLPKAGTSPEEYERKLNSMVDQFNQELKQLKLMRKEIKGSEGYTVKVTVSSRDKHLLNAIVKTFFDEYRQAAPLKIVK